MKRLKLLRRWFGRKFGYARLICLALLIGFAALRIADPAPLEELRVRTFDSFQRIVPRHKTARPVTIVDIDDNTLNAAAQKYPKARKFNDYRKMFDEVGKSIDAVTVSTPDHHHALGLGVRSQAQQVTAVRRAQSPRELHLHEDEQSLGHRCTVSFLFGLRP